jgi:hypothetical protein
MGKLTKQELIEGQHFVAQRDLKGLVRWARSLRIVTLDLEELEHTFSHEFRRPDLDRAFRLFQRYFFEVDRDEEYRQWRMSLLKWVIYSFSFGVGMFWMFCRVG